MADFPLRLTNYRRIPTLSAGPHAPQQRQSAVLALRIAPLWATRHAYHPAHSGDEKFSRARTNLVQAAKCLELECKRIRPKQADVCSAIGHGAEFLAADRLAIAEAKSN